MTERRECMRQEDERMSFGFRCVSVKRMKLPAYEGPAIEFLFSQSCRLVPCMQIALEINHTHLTLIDQRPPLVLRYWLCPLLSTLPLALVPAISDTSSHEMEVVDNLHG